LFSFDYFLSLLDFHHTNSIPIRTAPIRIRIGNGMEIAADGETLKDSSPLGQLPEEV